ncbi:39S ribosomal protein L32, mitochondrial [Aphis craccivora]|uniref:Large ribosomal subunit protein bL32m n=1 Tax=Aphis craccivora TaxID=307492 RepID=A0A6G0ZPU1_APHCR|nr:39S ribosomal protein L32, mitochondrial [Aphis craccivora]
MKGLVALRSIKNRLCTDIDAFCHMILGQTPPPALSFASPVETLKPSIPALTTIERLFGDSIFWAVPKHRRTIEKRLKRKFGCIDDFYKMLLPRTDLFTCNQCGHSYQRRHLCPNCYKRVKDETTELQEVIEKELGLEPIEQEVVVLYKGERTKQPVEEFWKGKRIIELKREKPSWFCRNLLQRTTIGNSDSKDVQPSELA